VKAARRRKARKSRGSGAPRGPDDDDPIGPLVS
jgi:hypothetical protein